MNNNSVTQRKPSTKPAARTKPPTGWHSVPAFVCHARYRVLMSLHHDSETRGTWSGSYEGWRISFEISLWPQYSGYVWRVQFFKAAAEPDGLLMDDIAEELGLTSYSVNYRDWTDSQLRTHQIAELTGHTKVSNGERESMANWLQGHGHPQAAAILRRGGKR